MQRGKEHREIPERAPNVHSPQAQAQPQAHFASGRHTAGLACAHNMSPSSDARTMRNRMYERDGVVCFCFKIGDLVPGDDPGAERAERRAGGRDPVGGLGYTLLPRASEMTCGWWAVSAALTCLRLEDSCADILASFLLPCTACCSVSSCPLLCGFL